MKCSYCEDGQLSIQMTNFDDEGWGGPVCMEALSCDRCQFAVPTQEHVIPYIPLVMYPYDSITKLEEK